MNHFKCDICSKETYVSPPTEPVFEMIDGKKVPVMVALKNMDFSTGEVTTVQVQKQKDLKARAHIIRLVAGQQMIQKDFCDWCLKKVMPQIEALWNKLENPN